MTPDEKAKWIAGMGTTECEKWAQATCIFGDRCHRKHSMLGRRDIKDREFPKVPAWLLPPWLLSLAEILLHHQLRSLTFISATPKLHLLDVIYATSVLHTSHLNAQLRALVTWISLSLSTPLILTNW
jgi:hypothetical protein